MVEQSQLKNLLAKKEYSRLEKILICLACDVDAPKEIKNIRDLAVSSGLRSAAKWNISQILINAAEPAVRLPEGWQLTLDGKKRISELVGPFGASPSTVIASALRQHIPHLRSADSKEFVEEAVECFEEILSNVVYGKFSSGVFLDQDAVLE